MPLPHCVAIFYNLPWFCSIKVSNENSQCNAENACQNRMCKRAFTIFNCFLELQFSRPYPIKSCRKTFHLIQLPLDGWIKGTMLQRERPGGNPIK